MDLRTGIGAVISIDRSTEVNTPSFLALITFPPRVADSQKRPEIGCFSTFEPLHSRGG
jgi:hypothetical protein